MGCIQLVQISPDQHTTMLSDRKLISTDIQERKVAEKAIIYFEESKQKTVVLGGLINIGNTCYMNSGLQCLFHTSILNQKLASSKQGQFTKQYKTVYERIKYFQSYEPKQLKTMIQSSNPQFQGYRQNDAGELISTVLNLIAQQTNQVASPAKKWAEIDTYYSETDKEFCERYIQRDQSRNFSVIDSTITGRFKTTYRCSNCEKQLRLFQKYNLVYLPIPIKKSDQQCLSLQDCIKQFNEPDILDSWDCLNCGVDCKHVKTMSIFSTNKILIFCLKRFTQSGIKKNNRVSISRQLSLLDIIEDKAQGKNKRIYELYGIINHFGHMQFGHYTALCFNQQRKQWYQYNDHHVLPISEEVLKKRQRNACILFYRLKEEINPMPQVQSPPFQYN